MMEERNVVELGLPVERATMPEPEVPLPCTVTLSAIRLAAWSCEFVAIPTSSERTTVLCSRTLALSALTPVERDAMLVADTWTLSAP